MITVKEVGLDFDMHVVTTLSPDGEPKSVKCKVVASDTVRDDTLSHLKTPKIMESVVAWAGDC